jgi:hypothetical protein
MRTSYETANSMARALPLNVEIGARAGCRHARAVGIDISSHSEAFIAHVAPALDQSAPSQVNQRQGFNHDTAFQEKRVDSIQPRRQWDKFLAKRATFARLCAVAQKNPEAKLIAVGP